MALTADQIKNSALTNEQKKVLEGVRAGTITAIDINASLITAEEKKAFEAVRAGSATRVGLSAMHLDPLLKRLLLEHAGV